MKIALIGYGKMGKEVEEFAREQGHTIVLKITSQNTGDFIPEYLSKADVAIEFTRPEAALENIIKCFNCNVPVITGTTGWYQHLEQVKQICKEKNGALLHASNFSIGVNIFFEINRRLSQLMANQQQYKVSIQEEHHTQKLDKPSGTAITLANDILSENKDLEKWSLFENDEKALHIDSIRKDKTIGMHSVSYQSTDDLISIKHEALSRKGFAKGALLAAQWLQNKKGVFTMGDVLV